MTAQEKQFSGFIDVAFLAHAEEDIYTILLVQRRQFNRRWYGHPTMKKIKVFLRYVGLLLCVVGASLCAGSLIMGVSWDGRIWPLWLLLGLFLFLAWFFFKLPKIEQLMQSWTERVSQKSCRKLAKKCVKQANRMVPFRAQYEIKGDLISYYRSQPGEKEGDEDWQFVWNRKMAGFAVQSPRATVFFKSKKSIQPKIIVLHDGLQALKDTLITLNVNTEEISQS